MTIRIFLADDHHLVRQGVRLLLESEADLEVVGEAGDGIQALEDATRLRPDVLVVDMVIPHLNGVEITHEIKRRLPATRIVLLSMYDNESYVLRAIEAGASAYVLKESTAGELATAIRAALEGRMYLSPPLDQEAIEEYARRTQETGDLYDSLTGRERQIFQMAAEGMSNPQIAERLSLSVRTVEMHRAHLLRKLNLKNQSDVILYAVKRGLVK